jgi:hypothetical protein
VIEATTRRLVKERSQGRCEKCGQPAAQMHHRKNRSQGGRWEPSNTLHLCLLCHLWCTEHPLLACSEGWSVRSYMTPRTVVVTLFGGRRVYLTDAGDYLEVEAA